MILRIIALWYGKEEPKKNSIYRYRFKSLVFSLIMQSRFEIKKP
jgi:hypothetical protein